MTDSASAHLLLPVLLTSLPSHPSAVAAGVTDEEVDGDAFPLFAEGKSLISHYLYRELKQACGGVYWNRTSGSKCDTLYYKMTEELSSLNVYDVLHDVSANGQVTC